MDKRGVTPVEAEHHIKKRKCISESCFNREKGLKGV